MALCYLTISHLCIFRFLINFCLSFASNHQLELPLFPFVYVLELWNGMSQLTKCSILTRRWLVTDPTTPNFKNLILQFVKIYKTFIPFSDYLRVFFASFHLSLSLKKRFFFLNSSHSLSVWKTDVWLNLAWVRLINRV